MSFENQPTILLVGASRGLGLAMAAEFLTRTFPRRRRAKTLFFRGELPDEDHVRILIDILRDTRTEATVDIVTNQVEQYDKIRAEDLAGNLTDN